MRKTKAEAAITRQTVLDSALVVFSEKGYAATNLQDIADHAGMTRGAIYWHFKDKTDLYTTLIGEVSARALDVIGQSIEAGGSFMEIARRMLTRTLEYLEKDEQYRLITELMLFKTARIPELEAGVAMKTQGMHMTIQQMADFFRDGIASGELRADLDPEMTAIAFLSLQNGLAMSWFLVERSFSLGQSAQAAADIFLAGLART